MSVQFKVHTSQKRLEFQEKNDRTNLLADGPIFAKAVNKILTFSSSGASGTTKIDTKSRKNDDDDDDDDDDDESLGESLSSLPPIYYVGAIILALVALVCMIRYCMKRFKHIFVPKVLKTSHKMPERYDHDHWTKPHLLHRAVIHMTYIFIFNASQ